MNKIVDLFGVEVIVYFPPMPTDQKINGIIQPTKLPEWIEGKVTRVGNECKKILPIGCNVIIHRDNYQQAPVLPKTQFDFGVHGDGQFKILPEYQIAMVVKSINPIGVNQHDV